MNTREAFTKQHEELTRWLKTPESFPQVKHEPMKKVRDEAHVKAKTRRFDDEARITAMGEL